MTLSNFNSLFELTAGFNFAYTLSDEFNANLNAKILNSFTELRDNLDNVEGKINLSKNNLHQVKGLDIPGVINSTNGVDEAKQSINKIEEEFKILKENSETKINESGITKSFVYLCLFNALYSLLILFIAGFFDSRDDSINDKIINETLIIVNLLSTIFICYCLFQEKINIKYRIGYYRSLFWFVIIAIIGITSYCINKIWLKSQCNFHLLNEISVIWSIILPMFHFIYYFYRAVKNSQFLSKDLIFKLNEFEKNFDELQKTQIESVIAFHENFGKYTVEKKEM
jgi:hypothetical protein